MKLHDYGIAKTSTVLEALYHRAEPNLTEEELEWLTRLGDTAENKAKWLGSMCESVGCLINQEGNNSGSFEDKAGVAELLLMIGENLETIGSLVHLSHFAASRLVNKDELRIKAE